jgi:predicted DNA binding CopG/RHH family protein
MNVTRPNPIPLDDYEKELAGFLEKGNYQEVNPDEFLETKQMFLQATKLYKNLQKSKRITLRINNQDLIKIKARASRNQIPYQRLINALIHKYAQGEMKLAI